MITLSTIEGIGDSYEESRYWLCRGSVEALLEAGASKKGRVQLAEKSGLSEKLILKWTNHADLFRIKGVAGEYAEFLEAAGVDTVVELATRNAANLAKKVEEVNDEKNLVRKLPTESMIEDWIKQAGELPRVMTY